MEQWMRFFRAPLFRNSARFGTGFIHVKGLQQPRGWGLFEEGLALLPGFSGTSVHPLQPR
jgi:hypothetical protein